MANILERLGGKSVRIVGIILTPFILITIFILFGQLYDNINRNIVIQKIIDTLGSGDSDIIDAWLSDNFLANPVWGSLILAFIFGMIFSLALKKDTPIPVWIIALFVVVIAMIIGISSWAIPITLIYISEAITGGMPIHSAVITLLILVGGAIVVGFGIGWYIRLATKSIERAFKAKPVGESAGAIDFLRHRRKTKNVRIKSRRNKR